MIESMATVHMTDEQVTADFPAVLENIRNGAEVIVEQDHCAVAVIRSPRGGRRLLSEAIAIAMARGSRRYRC